MNEFFFKIRFEKYRQKHEILGASVSSTRCLKETFKETRKIDDDIESMLQKFRGQQFQVKIKSPVQTIPENSSRVIFIL